jgi:ABC-type antimicrobial peptide transport system permease subunit
MVVQASDGSLGNDLVRVSGILKGVGENLDHSLVLIHEQDFASLFVFPGQYHEIALNSHGRMTPEEIAALLSDVSGTNELKTWRQLMPGVSDMLENFDGSSLIFEIVFFLIAGLGVMNTLLMSTFERIPEFGLLKAIGTTPWRILREISAEALILGFVSSTVGGVLGVCASWYLACNPIDLSGFTEGFSTSGVMMSARWGAYLTVEGVVWPIVFMWIVSLVASLYPAAKAARLNPVRALTHV